MIYFTKIFLIALKWLVIVLMCFGVYLGINYETSNVHTVIPNMMYRSAQLNYANLTKYTKQFHLKTIINLRGVKPTESWYQVERAFAQKNHLSYYSIHFRSDTLSSQDQLRKLVHVLQIAKKPLLLHCEGGADRTGMASAIAIILFTKNPTVSTIEEQDTWHYNVISSTTIGYQVLQNYFSWLNKNNYAASKKTFLIWINSNEKMHSYHGWFGNHFSKSILWCWDKLIMMRRIIVAPLKILPPSNQLKHIHAFIFNGISMCAELYSFVFFDRIKSN